MNLHLQKLRPLETTKPPDCSGGCSWRLGLETVLLLALKLFSDGGSDFVGELVHQAFGDAGVGAEDIAVVDSAAAGNHLGAVVETAEVEEAFVGDVLECHLAVKRVGTGRD